MKKDVKVMKKYKPHNHKKKKFFKDSKTKDL